MAGVSRDRNTFITNGVMFKRDWLVTEQRYVWTSECGSMRAGRNVGKQTYWAQANDGLVGRDFMSLKSAMLRATMAVDEIKKKVRS